LHLDQQYYVYILASDLGGTLYVGVTNNLLRRIYEHRQGTVSGFTARYDVHRLVYFDVFESAEAAIRREKQIKKWKRAWKIRLIEESNPNWDNLYEKLA
jgi:putative endonuclease